MSFECRKSDRGEQRINASRTRFLALDIVHGITLKSRHFLLPIWVETRRLSAIASARAVLPELDSGSIASS
jgi:hypothetical protein